MRKYLSTGKGVMHVSGGPECHPVAFLDYLFDLISEVVPSRSVCWIDPYNVLTATPVGVLRELAVCLGLNAAQSLGTSHFEVVKNVRSTFGSVYVDDVTVNNSYVEAEEVARLSRALTEEIKSGRQFHDVVVVFQGCEKVDPALRRTYYSTVWKPVLQPMVALGARTIFQYSAETLAADHDQIPARANKSLRLPSAFLDDIVVEIAALALEQGWERSAESADVFARTIKRGTASVSEVYAMLMLMDDDVRSS